jgi:cation:H+ antiporter
MALVEFALALIMILFGAALFTNAAEILGDRLGMQQGAVGSLLAGVGTALPETIIAIVAIMSSVLADGGEPANSAEIGVGAILGAPFMLATLALFAVGASALVFRTRRVQGTGISIDEATIGRDVGFFVIFFALAAGVGITELPFWPRLIVAGLLVGGYAYYVLLTAISGGRLEGVPERLLFMPRRHSPPLWVVVVQVLSGLGLIIGGAHLFVDAVKHTAGTIGLSAGLIALIVAPFATELPEKMNSILWVRCGKDTLALGNITGAMMFQSTIPVTFGILFTRWDLAPLDILAVGLALLSGGLLYLVLRYPATLRAWHLMVGGAFYSIFLLVTVFSVT